MHQKTTFFSLPAEIRLQIAAYVVEQSPEAGLIRQTFTADGNSSTYRLGLDKTYRASLNFNILLVCRQFQNDFTSLAWANTTFVLDYDLAQPIALRSLMLRRRWPVNAIPRVRRIIAIINANSFYDWNGRPFDHDTVRIDHLTLTTSYGRRLRRSTATLLLRLTNIKVIRFLFFDLNSEEHRKQYDSFITYMLEEDWHQRYETLGTPKIGNTWWEWSYDLEDISFSITARVPLATMDQEEYIKLMKPVYDAANYAPGDDRKTVTQRGPSVNFRTLIGSNRIALARTRRVQDRMSNR